MSKIICFLKFGEKDHMQGLALGKMFFSNALKYRQIEEELFIKGQGDKLEGGSIIHAQNVTMIDNGSQEVVMTGIKGNMLVHYEPANLLPVYCLFACYEKDCTINAEGKLEFHLSEEIERNVREHFPKANAVAIIENPEQFVTNVKSSIKTECVSGEVNYFNLYGIDSAQGQANDIRYFKYLTQDIPPEKVEGGMKYTFSAKYVYRSLLCKDVFFENEKEYRFVLPEEKISIGTIYTVNVEKEIAVVELNEFFDGNKR